MKIELRETTVRKLTEGYQDNNEDGGIVGYGGKLDIRPPYQREFVYKEKQRDAVIDTLIKEFPLNVMYWAVREDGNFEVIDGQQRTISICQFVDGDFSFDKRYFHNLQDDEQEKILDYKLMIYLCDGSNSERLDWFRIINIEGTKLRDQELRNATFHGPWLAEAKKYFSKSNCAADGIGKDYLKGELNRQDYLETAIKWISDNKIEDYMSKNQHEPNANELWLYFQSVINWVKTTFLKYRDEMKGLDWGFFYNEYKNQKYDSKKIEEEIVTLMEDEDVEKKSGIYPYILTRKEKHLNIRAFKDKQKREAYEKQKGICPICKEHFEIDEMEADHITPWHEGGKTDAKNCQMLCRDDNRRKSGK